MQLALVLRLAKEAHGFTTLDNFDTYGGSILQKTSKCHDRADIFKSINPVVEIRLFVLLKNVRYLRKRERL